MIKNILVPLDGSEHAEGALPYALAIASAAGARVLLVTAVQQLGVWDVTISLQVMEREELLAQAYLDEKVKSLKDGNEVEARLVRGTAAEAVLDAAKAATADLIAMSTHGRSGITRWLFGSVADRVLHSSETPLLIVRPDEDGKPKKAPAIKKILVPLDGSPIAESVLPFVEDLAKTLGASLVLFHAIAPITAYPGFEYAPPVSGELLESMQEQAREVVRRSAEEVQSRGVKAEGAVCIDQPVDGILQAATDMGCQLIAIGTHGRSRLGRMVLGSVADGVVRRSHLPCLVIHSREVRSLE